MNDWMIGGGDSHSNVKIRFRSFSKPAADMTRDM